MKLSPRAKVQAKFNGATIKGVYHFFETNSEIIILIQIACSLDENLCKIFINKLIFIFIHLCKSGFVYELQSRMIKLRRECGKGSFYYLKTRAPCELSITHNHELVTTSELLGFVVSVIFVNTFFKFIIRNKIHDLSKDSLSVWHDESK